MLQYSFWPAVHCNPVQESTGASQGNVCMYLSLFIFLDLQITNLEKYTAI